jgi:GAF domain-containing protein
LITRQGERSDGLQHLVDERVALQRVATLVAEGAPPDVLFTAVAEEVARLFDIALVTLNRYEGDECVVLADPHGSGFPVGSRWPLDGESLAAKVLATGKPARIDDYSDLSGPIADVMRLHPSASAVGVPVIVDGNVWGLLTVGKEGPDPMPSDTVDRVIGFTALVATALGNVEARGSLRRLAEEQAALRRVATLVAEGVSNDMLFAVVAEEVGRVVGVPDVTIDRYAPDGSASIVLAFWSSNDNSWWPVGSRWPLDGPSVAKQVWETGKPASMDDYPEHSGSIATHYHDRPSARSIGVPIVVDGKVWGLIAAGSTLGEHVPDDTEQRLAGFTELVATAIGNTEAWDRGRRLADEQAALRRVATLVAEGKSADELFAAVCEEVGRVVGVPSVTLDRFDPDGSGITVLGSWEAPGELIWPVGSRWPLDGPSVAKSIWDTKRPAQLTDYRRLTGTIAEHYSATPLGRAIGVPIVVDNGLWGMIAVSSSEADEVPTDAEATLAGFTELVATAIANSQARDSVRALVTEQTALRRLAILVAKSAPSAEFFSAVAAEVGAVLGVPGVTVDRFDGDGASSTVVASWGEEPFPAGTRWPVEEGTVAWTVLDTGGPARVDDYGRVRGRVADAVHDVYPDASIVGVPIVVEGRVWGMIGVGTPWPGILPPDTEARLGRFTDLVTTAISSREARHGLRTLADEQAALRRVATLVAEGAPAAALFAAVAEEVAQVVGVPTVTIGRFEDGPSFAVVGVANNPGFPVGSRWPLDGPSMARTVFDQGRAARIEDYADLPGTIAEAIRSTDIVSAVGAPIVVDGSVWGYISVSATDAVPLQADTEERLGKFTEIVATAISKAESDGALTRLVDQQAALRRVATLVAEGAEPAELFDAVAWEIGQLFDFAAVTLNRYEEDAVVVLSDPLDSGFPVGSRWPFDGDSLAVRVHATHGVARIDDYSDIDSSAAVRMRERESRSAMGVPIFVEGELWGLLCVGAAPNELMPADTEARIAGFVDLVGTAIANGQARDGLRLLAEEQAALRRVATLVARDAPSTDVFAAVATEVGSLLDADMTVVGRYDDDEAATALGSWSAAPGGVPVGTRSAVGGRNVLSLVAETGRPARVDGYDDASGEAADIARSHGWRSSIAAPIVVEGRLWGVMLVATKRPEPFPAGSEERLSAFTDLVATALANAQAHDEVRRFADEQAALGRVATLVAEGAKTTRLYEAVLEEVVDVLDVPAAWLVHYESDEWMSVLASLNDPFFPAGSRWPLEGTSTSSTVFRTGRSALVEDFGGLEGAIAEQTRGSGFVSSLGVPIVVGGEIWGAVCVGTTKPKSLPADTEPRLARFTHLVATAISNTQSRDRVDTLVAEQTALHRIADLVARGTDSAIVFDSVCEETGAVIGATRVTLVEFTPDGFALPLAGWSLHGAALLVGTKFGLGPGSVGGMIARTGEPARIESEEGSDRQLEEFLREHGVRSRIGAPVVVEGRLWGALMASTTEGEGPFPPGTEDRLARFTELIATAVSNAATRSELIASRARIVAAGDEARRRIERNLHDGTQQRLVSLGLALRAAEADLAPEQDVLRGRLAGVASGLANAVEELQELSRGIHPGVLAKSGLAPALQALAHRSAIPVHLDITTNARFAEPIEVAAYFAASEALANAAKHSEAARIDVSLAERDGSLVLSIEDDGVGGADSTRGSGLVGLHDRVEAIGGSISVESRPGAGTRIVAALPVELEPLQAGEPR